MKKTIPLSVVILGVGTALGLFGIVLFSGAAAGVNVPLFVVLTLGGIALVRFIDRGLVSGNDWSLLGILLFFALGFAWRDSLMLHALGCGAALLVVLDLSIRAHGKTLADCGPYAAGKEFGRAVAGLFRSTPDLVRHEIPWGEYRTARAVQVRAMGRGMIGVVPVLLLFGSLFASADARFEAFSANLLDWDVAVLIQRLLIFSICLWVSVALIRLCCASPGNTGESVQPPPWHCGAIEVAMVLAALNALFLSYVVIQSSYFFGDDALVRGRNVLSYSAYARRGFFELVWISVLLLPTLFCARWLMREEGGFASRAFTILGGGLVFFVIVIVASAMHRMHLYVDAYGLTELRFYSSAFMVWLSIIYAWFCATTLLGRPGRFVQGVIASALLTTVVLYVVNPDAVIARTNVDRLADTGRLDTRYLLNLSADAVPELLEAFATDRSQTGSSVVREMRFNERWYDSEGWRGWNWSRARADALLTHTARPDR